MSIMSLAEEGERIWEAVQLTFWTEQEIARRQPFDMAAGVDMLERVRYHLAERIQETQILLTIEIEMVPYYMRRGGVRE